MEWKMETKWEKWPPVLPQRRFSTDSLTYPWMRGKNSVPGRLTRLKCVWLKYNKIKTWPRPVSSNLSFYASAAAKLNIASLPFLSVVCLGNFSHKNMDGSFVLRRQCYHHLKKLNKRVVRREDCVVKWGSECWCAWIGLSASWSIWQFSLLNSFAIKEILPF